MITSTVSIYSSREAAPAARGKCHGRKHRVSAVMLSVAVFSFCMIIQRTGFIFARFEWSKQLPQFSAPEPARFEERGRRTTTMMVIASAITAGLEIAPPSAEAVSPTTPFEWSFIWNQKGAEADEPKQMGLPRSKVAEILRKDLAESQYTLTGKLTPGIFRDDCRFVDPNNAVDGLSKYRQALGFLFDPAVSNLQLTGDVRLTGENTIEADYVASGTIKLPWRPQIPPWSGHLVYTLDNDGLIAVQEDTWNITRFDAIRETFSPR